MDYFIIAVAVAAGLYFHWWLFLRIRSWTDRDMALKNASWKLGLKVQRMPMA